MSGWVRIKQLHSYKDSTDENLAATKTHQTDLCFHLNVRGKTITSPDHNVLLHKHMHGLSLYNLAIWYIFNTEGVNGWENPLCGLETGVGDLLP